MRVLRLRPYEFDCTIEECPTGLFLSDDQVCFKSEYGDNDGKLDVYNSAGELICSNHYKDLVTPLTCDFEEE